jgi:phosphoenolpyruvate carboxylase
MTIDDVMRLAPKYASLVAAAIQSGTAESSAKEDVAYDELRAAILALLDAEAEACAEACRSEQLMTVCDATDAAYMHAIDDCVKAIRARIAARRGGAKP